MCSPGPLCLPSLSPTPSLLHLRPVRAAGRHRQQEEREDQCFQLGRDAWPVITRPAGAALAPGGPARSAQELCTPPFPRTETRSPGPTPQAKANLFSKNECPSFAEKWGSKSLASPGPVLSGCLTGPHGSPWRGYHYPHFADEQAQPPSPSPKATVSRGRMCPRSP